MIASPDTPLDAFLDRPNALLPMTSAQQGAHRARLAARVDQLIDIELGEAMDAAGIFRCFARAFDMPRWFGHNWDALEECLGDLDWLPGGSVLVRVRGRIPNKDDADMLRATLESACDAWQGVGRAFHVLIEPELVSGR